MIHTCNLDELNERPLAGLIRSKLENVDLSQTKPAEIVNQLKQESGIEVKYVTAYKALEREKLKRNVVLENSYECLNALIKSFDVDTVFNRIELNERNEFKRFFMTWKATKEFFKKNRKIVNVDGTFLAGPNKGTLLAAVAQDAENKLVLLAYAIVESENTESWTFFMSNLKTHFDIDNEKNHVDVRW